MTMGGAGSASSALAIANPVPAAGVTSMIATSGRCARGRYHLVAGLEAGCDIDAFGAQQRYESGAGDLVIVDDDDPGRPPTGAGGAGWHDEWWAPAEGVFHLGWRRGRSVRRHVVGHVLCLDLGVVVESVEPGDGQRPLSLPCVRSEVRLVA